MTMPTKSSGSLVSLALSRLAAAIVILMTLPIIWLTVTTPMSVAHQGLFGLTTIVAMLVLLRLRPRSRRVALFLILLSAVISTRYLYWRATETLVFQSTLEAVLGYGLFAAELYAWIILILGYAQNLWPLERRVQPLPKDTSQWPTVDVYIPTYNESLQIVQDTVLAAQNLDYPRDKLNIYLLDDGRRDSFAAFAAAAGVGYITRSDNQHAKAGNLNHAMTQTRGELICIFDCDHVTTRAFLQMTVGSFVADDGLALIQTPHYFYSPDPFERNLSVGHQMPSEDELFYGLIQKGNDYWNATFFCGSCAVIRRSALEEIGGFAVETVTEDAHTALKLQRLGWRTAYLGVPLAAGLATERLSLHVGQRMRWARGMTQILRMDNPLFGRGLSFMQRLCYLNAILHFQFALPRIAFLTAPLAYLLGGQNIIAASAAMIFVYALPHLAHTLILNSLLQGRYRFSFWAEIYETVLSFHLVKVTLATLFNPRRGKFNVTDKGGLLPEGFFDFRIVRPHLVVAALLTVGIVWGVIRYFWPQSFGVERNVMLLNLFWASFSLLMLLAAIAVARESRQVRHSVRVDVALPTVAYLADGHAIMAVTRNLSMGGALVELSGPPSDQNIEWIELRQGGQFATFPVTEVNRQEAESKSSESKSSEIRLRFGSLDVGQRRQLVKAVMGRADAWVSRADYVDHPLRSLWWVVKAVFGLFFTSWQQRRAQPAAAANPGASSVWIAGRVLMLAVLAALLLLSVRTALSDERGGAGLPQPVVDAQGELSLVKREAPLAASDRTADADAPAPDAGAPSLGALGLGAEVWESVPLSQLTGGDDLQLHGRHAAAGVPFSLRVDDIATQASLLLELRMPASGAADRQRLRISLNGQQLSSRMLEQEPGGRFSLEIPIEPALLVEHNHLDFALVSQGDDQCLTPQASDEAVTIEGSSLLQLALRRLPLKRDLANFPLPFYSDVAASSAPVTIALPADPSEDTLQAATLIASYLGSRAGSRALGFRVVQGQLPSDDAIVLANGDESITGLTPEQISGDGARLLENPYDASRTLLLIHGDSPASLVEAARDFVINQSKLTGQARVAQPVSLPTWSENEVPGWVSSDKPVELSSLVSPEALRSAGLSHSAIDLHFRAAPDLFLWPGQTLPLTLHYTFPNADWLDESRSRLDVTMNGTYLGALGVNRVGVFERIWGWLGGDIRRDSGTIRIPPYLIYGENTLSLYFNLKAGDNLTCLPERDSGNAGTDQGNGHRDMLSRIGPDSTLDFSQARHFASLPNLSYFVGAGFPFTRHPDLASTAIVLPQSPDVSELTTLLNVAARFGESTGVAAYRVAVGLGRNALARYADRDLLIVSETRTPLMTALLEDAPVGVSNGTLVARTASLRDRLEGWMRGDWRRNDEPLRRALVSRRHVNALIGFESPWQSGRSVVALTADESQALPKLVSALDRHSVSRSIRGDVALVDGDGSVATFAVASTYQVGSMPWPLRWYWLFGERPWWLMWLLIASLLLCTLMLCPILKRRADRRMQGSGQVAAEGHVRNGERS